MTARHPASGLVSRSVARGCPVCDAEKGDALFDNRMAPIANIDFSYAVVACDECGMIYASHTPDDATMDRYYRDLSKYDHPRSVDELSDGDVHRAKVAAAFARRMLASVGRVLDVGCASGLFLSALKASGSFTVRGLDPSPASADVAHRLFDVPVEVCNAHDYDRYDAFDGIALLAVLEHVRDPGRLLSTIARRMKPGALLIIEVPSADLFAAYPDIGSSSEPFGEFSNEHINFFGKVSLRRLAERAGLSWVASDEFPYLAGIRGLIAAFRKGGQTVSDEKIDRASRPSVSRYVEASAAALLEVEARLASILDQPIVLYGAGSHSARLLGQGGLRHARIDAVLDRNPHLTGHTIGDHAIHLPSALTTLPCRPVVVSSFHARAAIMRDLRAHHDNELVVLYPEPAAPRTAMQAWPTP